MARVTTCASLRNPSWPYFGPLASLRSISGLCSLDPCWTGQAPSSLQSPVSLLLLIATSALRHFAAQQPVTELAGALLVAWPLPGFLHDDVCFCMMHALFGL